MTKTKDSITKKLEIKSKLRKISILTRKTCLIFLKVILLINVRNLSNVRKSLKTHKMNFKVKMFKCLVNTSAIFATPNSKVGTL